MKKFKIFALLIIPVILIFTAAALKHARGPYFICSNTDNDYLYLVSSLAVADFKQVFFTDHPGTTLQILGAITLKITYALDFSKEDELAVAILKNPEFYIKVINIILISLNVLILFFIGLVTFNLTKNIGLSLLLQFSPFFSNVILIWCLNNVSCEPLLLFTSMLFVLILIKIIFDENIFKSSHWYVIALAFISGFGMATKVTFLPMLIIPLIVLPKLMNKLGFVLLTILSALLWTWPVHSQYGRILNFFYDTLTHRAWYGYGQSGLDIHTVKYNILTTVVELLSSPLNIVFFLVPVLIIIFNLFSKTRKTVWQDMSFRILLAVMIAELLSVLIVVKQSAERYAVPSLCLIGLLLFLQLIYLQKRDYIRDLNAPKITYLIIIFLIGSGIWNVLNLKSTYEELLLIKNESLAYYSKAEDDYKNYLKIFINLQPRSIAPFALAGLSYGNNMASHKYFNISEIAEGKYSKGIYSETLQRIYGDVYFYNLCSGEFYTWTKSFLIEDLVKGKIDKIVFFAPPSFVQKKDILLPCRSGSVLQLKDISRGIYDNIYIWEGVPPKNVNYEQYRFHCY